MSSGLNFRTAHHRRAPHRSIRAAVLSLVQAVAEGLLEMEDPVAAEPRSSASPVTLMAATALFAWVWWRISNRCSRLWPRSAATVEVAQKRMARLNIVAAKQECAKRHLVLTGELSTLVDRLARHELGNCVAADYATSSASARKPPPPVPLQHCDKTQIN